MITDKMFYKMIDNLPYSIKPKNYDEFRRNLTKCLKKKLFPGNPNTLYEMMVECQMVQLKKNGINVPMKMVSESAIVVISLIYDCTNGENFEVKLDVPPGCPKKFMEIIMESQKKRY